MNDVLKNSVWKGLQFRSNLKSNLTIFCSVWILSKHYKRKMELLAIFILTKIHNGRLTRIGFSLFKFRGRNKATLS